jgi:hypothetical protein
VTATSTVTVTAIGPRKASGETSHRRSRSAHDGGRAASSTRSTNPAGARSGSTACSTATVARNRASSRRHSGQPPR